MLNQQSFKDQLLRGSAVLLFLLIVFYFFSHAISSYDLGMHLTSGKQIVESGQILHQESFSFTAQGKSYINHEWLSQVVMYKIYSLFGIIGLHALHLLLIGLLFLILCSFGSESLAVWKCFLLLLIVPMAILHDDMRPHIFSWVLLALLVFVVHEKRIWLIPFILLLWVNVHASFVLGLLYAFVFIVRAWLLQKNHLLLLLLILVLFVTILNPWGIHIYSLFLQDTSALNYIVEWKVLHPSRIFFWIFFLYVFVLGGSMWRNKRIELFDLILFLSIAILGVMAIRFVVIAGIMLWPLMLKYATFKDKQYQTRVFLVYLLFMILLFRPINNYKQGFRFSLNHEVLPVYATDFMIKNKIEGKVFNDYVFGGYQIWKQPKLPVFIDGRLAPYIPIVFNDYLIISEASSSWQKLLNKYAITIVMVRTDRKLAKALMTDTAWKMVYFDYNAVIYTKKTLNTNLRTIQHISPWGLRKQSTNLAAIEELKYICQINPTYFGAIKYIADLYMLEGDVKMHNIYDNLYQKMKKQRNSFF